MSEKREDGEKPENGVQSPLRSRGDVGAADRGVADSRSHRGVSDPPLRPGCPTPPPFGHLPYCAGEASSSPIAQERRAPPLQRRGGTVGSSILRPFCCPHNRLRHKASMPSAPTTRPANASSSTAAARPSSTSAPTIKCAAPRGRRSIKFHLRLLTQCSPLKTNASSSTVA